MPTIMLDDITAEALQVYQVIFAEAPDGRMKIWDSRRLLPFVERSQKGTRIEIADVLVASLHDADLASLREKIRAAGGDRGLLS